MSILWSALTVVVATAVAVGIMLLVRRRAPEGSYFKDGDRASGVFGVMATGFSVLLGFIIFLAFSSYDAARAGAETEASVVAQQVQTAQFFPKAQRPVLSAQLVCYGRSVAGVEWDRLRTGKHDDLINPWSVAMFRTVKATKPGSDTEQSAYDRWMDQTATRQEARQERVHGVSGVVPAPLWIVLYLIAAVIFVYMLFFADSAEGAGTQAMLMGSVTIVITTLLLLLGFFNRPFDSQVGGLKPTAMERTLRIVDEEVNVAGLELTLPCDAEGRPV
jgi:hypothetical protein